MEPEEPPPKPESSYCSPGSPEPRPSTSENENRNKNGKSKPTYKFKREQRYSYTTRDDHLINERLAMIKAPTINLPIMKPVEQKFSGRARLFIGNLPPKVTADEIKQLFGKFGETSEIFIFASKAFGFIRMDYRINAERAKNELSRYNLQGKNLVIRSAYPAAIRVKNIPLLVSNELLHMAFSIFGDVELAYIVVDERGRPTGEGVVEYFKKPSALLAIKKCMEGCFVLTSSLKPVIVENYEPPIDTTGYSELMIKKSQDYYREREAAPRFATPGSFQFQYAERWKALYLKYKAKLDTLQTEQCFEEKKLENEMLSAQYDHETEQLKEMLRMREMDRKRFKQNWEMRQRELEERRLQKFDEPGSRLQANLYRQANQLNRLLDHEEQLQEQWQVADYSGNELYSQRGEMQQLPSSTSQCWLRDRSFRPMTKRPRH